MKEWVLFDTIPALLMYGLSAFFCLFDRRHAGMRGTFTLLSAVLCIAATALLLLNGASLREGAALLIVFLLLNLEVNR